MKFVDSVYKWLQVIKFIPPLLWVVTKPKPLLYRSWGLSIFPPLLSCKWPRLITQGLIMLEISKDSVHCEAGFFVLTYHIFEIMKTHFGNIITPMLRYWRLPTKLYWVYIFCSEEVDGDSSVAVSGMIALYFLLSLELRTVCKCTNYHLDQW